MQIKVMNETTRGTQIGGRVGELIKYASKWDNQDYKRQLRPQEEFEQGGWFE
jgi:hypothetical protein